MSNVTSETSQKLQTELNNALCEKQHTHQAALKQQEEMDQMDVMSHDIFKLTTENERLQSKLAEMLETQHAYEDAISQYQKNADNAAELTHENQELVNRRLQDKLKDATSQKAHDYEAAVLQKQKDADKLTCLKHDNQRLAYENKKLQGKLEDALNEYAHQVSVSQPQKDADKLNCLTYENQQMASEMKRLQGNLEESVNELQHAQKQQQRDRETCCRLEEKVKKEKARFLKMHKIIEMGKMASITSIGKLYDMQTLVMENDNLKTKMKDIEAKYGGTLSENHSLSKLHGKMSQKDEIIAENQATIARLECLINTLNTQQSESKAQQANLEDPLGQARTHSTAWWERSNQSASAFEKERALREQYQAELKEAHRKQNKAMAEQHQLTEALKRSQDNFRRLQEQLQSESNNQLKLLTDSEFRFKEQKISLDQGRDD